MENEELIKMIDQERWLLNNGLISDSVKNQLFFCGSIVHKDVQAVEVAIKADAKIVDYIIYVSPKLFRNIEKYKLLSTSNTLFGMWRFKRLLKKEGCLDFRKVLGSLVGEYCGPKWTASATVLNFDSYVDSIEAEDGNQENSVVNRPLDIG